MKTRLFVFLLLIGLVFSAFQVAGATTRPTIVVFESSLKAITVSDAEAGATTTTLTWHTVGVTEEYRVLLHTYMLDDWELVFPQESVPLEANGARVVTIRHPLNFGPPTFLLSIVSAGSNAIVDQRIVTIPYDTAAVSGPPAITSFSTEVGGVDAAQMVAGTARVMVAWSVAGRVPTSNLVFEQVFADGTATSVELPRLNLWVPSSAEGPLAPVYRAGEQTVVLRLRVLDAVAGTVYAEQTLELPVTGTPGPAGVPTATPAPQPPQPQPQPVSGEIVSFTALPTTVNPGAAVTLAWDVRGTGGVTIEQTVPNMTAVDTVVNARSPKGTAQVYVPGYAAYSVTFTLYTANRASSATAVVNVHCPFTFFFGAADGCPSGAASEVGASYQAFEGGHMIWRADTNEIYVHFEDGTAAYYLERDYARLGEPVLDDVPPLDRQAPVSGFGKVWANAPGVREKLGWALDDEQGYTARTQRVAQTRVPHPEFVFYITLPGGEVIGSGFGKWRQVA